MKTFPDFTWEYITKAFEWHLYAADQLSKLGFPPQMSNRHLVVAEAFLPILSKLQQHPQVKNWVPMLSMMTLRWFPSEDCSINLYFDQRETAYMIEIFIKNEVDEKVTVSLDNVADEIYTYIIKLRDD